MASIHRRPDSQYWHAAYFGPDGRRILRSTKQQDRQSALAVAMEYERASKLARRGELVEAQAREVLKDIMKRADMGETLQIVSIKSHFDTWLASKKDRKSEGTGERYGVAVEEFLKTLGKRANKNLTSLTAADVQRFLDHRAAKGLAPKTVNVDVKIIRGALNAARRQGLIPTNPAEAVELPEAIGMERGTFTPAEVKMLVDTAEGEWKMLIMLAYFTGARLSDCCRMQWEGVDLTEETLTYTQAKTGAKVTAPLHPDLLARLNKLAGTDKPEVFIMPHMANLRPGGRHGLSETFKKIMRKAGVDSQTVKGAGKQMFSRRSFHALRHSFTSALANQNVSSELRMKLTGHKTEGEHRKYTHHEMDNLRAAIKKIPSLR
ncbi:MAG: tyrosine-type recombinase/integrase [Limisphaerales bacterium]